MLRSMQKNSSTGMSAIIRCTPSSTAKLVEAAAPHSRRAGARGSEDLRLHGAATLNATLLLLLVQARTKLAFQRKFEIANCAQLRWEKVLLGPTCARDQTYCAASQKWSGSISVTPRSKFGPARMSRPEGPSGAAILCNRKSQTCVETPVSSFALCCAPTEAWPRRAFLSVARNPSRCVRRRDLDRLADLDAKIFNEMVDADATVHPRLWCVVQRH